MRIMLTQENQQLKSMRLLFPQTVPEKAITLEKGTISSQVTEHRAHEQRDHRVLKRDLRPGQVTCGRGQGQHLD